MTPEQQAEYAASEDAWQARQCAIRLSKMQSRLGPLFAACTLENYTTAQKGQAQILAKVKAIDARLEDSIRKGESIVWFGGAGTGKDHMMASLIYHAVGPLAKGVTWMNGLKFFDAARQHSMQRDAEWSQTIMGTCERADILAMSDPAPPGADPTSNGVNALFRVVDTRYRYRKPTWITLNVSSVEEMEKLLTVPLCDRLRQGGYFLPCFWKSHREASK